MATLTNVGDSTSLYVPVPASSVLVTLSGTYNLTVALQKERGSKGSGNWQTLNKFSVANASVFHNYTSGKNAENLRLIITAKTSGSVTANATSYCEKADTPAYVFSKGHISEIKRTPELTLWSFSTADAASVVDTTGYFNEIGHLLRFGDLIFVKASVGGSQENGLMIVRAPNGGNIDVANINSLGLSNTD